MKTVFLRALDADDKSLALRLAIRDAKSVHALQRFEIDPGSFAIVPRAPFAYWVSDSLRRLFVEFPAFGAEGRIAASGGKTLDDFRWIRAAWEVPYVATSTWVGFSKGGSFSQYYADIHLLLDWKNDARALKEYLVTYRSTRGWSPNWTAELHGSEHYLRPGLTWPRRTQGGLSLRVMPAGCVFGDKGPAAFVEGDDRGDLLPLLAIVNSKVFRALIEVQMAFGSYEVGVVQRTPVPNLSAMESSALGSLARGAWSLKHKLDTRTETSHAFVLPALLQVPGEAVDARASRWAERVRCMVTNLAAIQVEIDDLCLSLYRIEEADRLVIREGVTSERGDRPEIDADADNESDPEEDLESNDNSDKVTLAAELVSWAVGVALGRFDIRLGTNERPLPGEPDPFSALPMCSPAMLTGVDGQPLARVPCGYPIAFPENGILVDDVGHAYDLTNAVHVVLDAIFKASTDIWWSEVGALLEPRGHEIRSWLASSFFEHHLKRHCRSRRKAPIIWQFAVPSGRYSIWLYSHRLTQDSIFQVQNDVVAPKLAHEERQLTSLVHGAGPNPTAKERKANADQEAFVEELRSLLDEVKRVAPLWNPVLDDGVVLVMAPLWRLVPQHKAWQNELKSKWGELSAGKYDWSHTAMYLWPERVIPKCATDRSLAIAHGLEDVFWVEVDNGKWKPRPTPKDPVDELVRGRTSVAVKAALKGLTEASPPNGPRARTRRSSP
jgi:hypothetical protein